MVVNASAVELSMVSPPDCSCCCLAGSLVVRSGLIFSQVFPLSRERNRYWAPMYTVRLSFGLGRMGEFQFQRYFGSPACSRGLMLDRSNVFLWTRSASPPCLSTYA